MRTSLLVILVGILLAGVVRAQGPDFLPTLPPAPMSRIDREKSVDEIRACVESVCGPASSNWGNHDIQNRPGDDLQWRSYWRQNFQDRIGKLASQETLIRRGFQERFLRLLEGPFTWSAESPLRVLIGFHDAVQLILPYVQASIEAKDGRAVFNRDRFLISIDRLAAPRKLLFRVMAEQIVAPIIERSQIFLGSDRLLEHRLRRLYPADLPLAEALRREGARSLKRYQELSARLGDEAPVVLHPVRPELLEKASRGEGLALADSLKFVSDMDYLDSLRRIYDRGLLERSLLSLMEEELPRLRQLLKVRFVQEGGVYPTLSYGSSPAVTSCETRFMTSMAMNASPLRYDQLRQKIRWVKDAAKEVAVRYADVSHRQSLEQLIERVDFAFEQTNDERVSIFVSQVENFERLLSMGQDVLRASDGRSDQLVFAWNLLEYFLSLKNSGEVRSVEALCKTLPTSALSDFASAPGHRIALSWFTAHNLEQGLPVMAHELGHLVSRALRFQQQNGARNTLFNQSLSCVANRNPFVTQPVELAGNDNSQWSEEDWADHFSAFVMNRLAQNQGPLLTSGNLGCSMVVDIGNEYKETTLAPAQNDPKHSSGLLRLLMTSVDRRTVTPACQKFLDYAAPAQRQLECP